MTPGHRPTRWLGRSRYESHPSDCRCLPNDWNLFHADPADPADPGIPTYLQHYLTSWQPGVPPQKRVLMPARSTAMPTLQSQATRLPHFGVKRPRKWLSDDWCTCHVIKGVRCSSVALIPSAKMLPLLSITGASRT